jgi:thiamine biosynthesis lipoprotein
MRSRPGSGHFLRLRLSLRRPAFLLRLSLGLIFWPLRAACGETAVVERRIVSMGTVLELRVGALDRPAALAASEEALREIERVERLLSTWKRGGPLDRLNRARPQESVGLGRETADLLAEVEAWSRRTGGAFDPTVLPLVRIWDLRGAGRIPSAAERERALEATGWRRFSFDLERAEAKRRWGAGIDEGAWGKGYALDAAAGTLMRSGVREAVLDLGGQVSAIGPATVAIADPRGRRRTAASLDIVDESVSTSGNSERGIFVAGRRVGHLLDPRTGQPAPDFGSVTVVAPSGLAADILSTAFFVLGPEKGLELSRRLRGQGFENEAFFLVVRDGGVETFASHGLRFHSSRGVTR